MAYPGLLAVSVGNTRTRLGAFVDGQLTASATHDNDKPERILEGLQTVYAAIHEREGAQVLLASVRPDAAEQATSLLQSELKADVMRVEIDMPIPVGRQLDREALVGEDRLLNAAAAYDVMKQSCVVVDAGTAVTVDFVDGAGTFHGGAILPGAQMMLDALNKRAAQLPEVELSRPDESIGHNTTEAMLSGVYYGIRGAVQELVMQYAEQVGQYPSVIATGGDGDLLFRDDARVDRIAPDLTLLGMFATFRKALDPEA